MAIGSDHIGDAPTVSAIPYTSNLTSNVGYDANEQIEVDKNLGNYRSAWWRFVAPANGSYSFDTFQTSAVNGGGYDTVIEVIDASTYDVIRANDQFDYRDTSLTWATLSAGEAIYVRVTSYTDVAMDYILHIDSYIPVVGADFKSDATLVVPNRGFGTPSSYESDETSNAALTTDSDDAGLGGYRSAWWKFTGGSYWEIIPYSNSTFLIVNLIDSSGTVIKTLGSGNSVFFRGDFGQTYYIRIATESDVVDKYLLLIRPYEPQYIPNPIPISFGTDGSFTSAPLTNQNQPSDTFDDSTYRPMWFTFVTQSTGLYFANGQQSDNPVVLSAWVEDGPDHYSQIDLGSTVSVNGYPAGTRAWLRVASFDTSISNYVLSVQGPAPEAPGANILVPAATAAADNAPVTVTRPATFIVPPAQAAADASGSIPLPVTTVDVPAAEADAVAGLGRLARLLRAPAAQADARADTISLARLRRVLIEPAAGDTVPTSRPVFTVGLSLRAGEIDAATVEIQFDDDEDFAHSPQIISITTTDITEGVNAPLSVAAPTDLADGTWYWRARVAGADASWTPARVFTVNTTPASSSFDIPITFSVSGSTPTYPHLWLVSPEDVTPGDQLTVFGSGLGTSPTTVRIGDADLPVDSWSYVPASGWADTAERHIGPNGVDPAHYELIVTIPETATEDPEADPSGPVSTTGTLAGTIGPSNGVYVSINRQPLYEFTGWEIRVRDHLSDNELVANVFDFISFTIHVELNNSGSGSVTMNRDSPFWSQALSNGEPAASILDREFMWEAYEDGILRHQWLGRTVDETQVEDTETRLVTVSGPGMAETLRNAVVMRPGFPKPVPEELYKDISKARESTSDTDDTPALNWMFPNKWPTMRMWYTLLKSAQSRGTCTFIKPSFTATKDSAGNKWVYIPTILTASNAKEGFQPTRGTNLLEFLDDCTGQDYSKHFAQRTEWLMHPGLKLEVRPTIGIEKQSTVVFFEGTLNSKYRSRNREEIANYIVVEDANGRTTLREDKKSIAKWGKREQVNTRNPQVTDEDRREKIGDVYLELQKDEKTEWTITVPADDTNTRRPFWHYKVGDWIGIARYIETGGESVIEPFRVLAIALTLDSEIPTVELTLQSKIEFRARKLEKRLDEIINDIKILMEESANLNDRVTSLEGKVGKPAMYVSATDPATDSNLNVATGDFWIEIADYY